MSLIGLFLSGTEMRFMRPRPGFRFAGGSPPGYGHRMKTLLKLPIALLLGGALWLGTPQLSYAQMQLGPPTGQQIDDRARPPKIDDPGKSPVLLYYGVVILGAAAVIGLAVMPSKRTHQD